ncbi:MAG TPA: zinc ribbon domain-containing protein [Pseudonocardiaceae bacterium]|nr:zinc ribbon domain-containing protein [Pseudonocardiaceae bacterium]
MRSPPGRSPSRSDPLACGTWGRWFPSSKTCSTCGAVADTLPLSVREWTCPGCGSVHDRDVNAARTLLAAGLAVSACGDGVRPTRSSPVRQLSRPPLRG